MQPALQDVCDFTLAGGNNGFRDNRINCQVSVTDARRDQERGPFHFRGSPRPTGFPYGANFAEMRDGTSNTVLLGEIIAAAPRGDFRGVWAFDAGVWFCGADPSYRQNCDGYRCYVRPNGNALDDNQMDRPGGCGYNGVPDRQMRCSLPPNPTTRTYQTARSRHPGGVHVCMADGSVQFINETIDLEAWLVMLAMANQGVGVTTIMPAAP